MNVGSMPAGLSESAPPSSLLGVRAPTPPSPSVCVCGGVRWGWVGRGVLQVKGQDQWSTAAPEPPQLTEQPGG